MIELRKNVWSLISCLWYSAFIILPCIAKLNIEIKVIRLIAVVGFHLVPGTKCASPGSIKFASKNIGITTKTSNKSNQKPTGEYYNFHYTLTFIKWQRRKIVCTKCDFGGLHPTTNENETRGKKTQPTYNTKLINWTYLFFYLSCINRRLLDVIIVVVVVLVDSDSGSIGAKEKSAQCSINIMWNITIAMCLTNQPEYYFRLYHFYIRISFSWADLPPIFLIHLRFTQSRHRAICKFFHLNAQRLEMKNRKCWGYKKKIGNSFYNMPYHTKYVCINRYWLKKKWIEQRIKTTTKSRKKNRNIHV